ERALQGVGRGPVPAGHRRRCERGLGSLSYRELSPAKGGAVPGGRSGGMTGVSCTNPGAESAGTRMTRDVGEDCRRALLDTEEALCPPQCPYCKKQGRVMMRMPQLPLVGTF